MQVILLLNYKNAFFPDSHIPYFFFPVQKDTCILDMVLQSLSQQLSVSRVVFLVHRELYSPVVLSRLEGYTHTSPVPCMLQYTEIYNSPLHAEASLVENEPILVLDTAVVYKNLSSFYQASLPHAMSQLYSPEQEEVGIFYFQTKDIYLKVQTEDIPLFSYVESDSTNLLFLNTHEHYIQYLRETTSLLRTPVEKEFRYPLLDTCTVIFRMISPGEGFRLDTCSIALLLEGTLGVVDEDIVCPCGTIMAGRGLFVAKEYSKVCVIDDASIVETKDFCGLIDLSQNFSDGWIVSEKAPSMVYTTQYDVYLEQGKRDSVFQVSSTQTPELYLLYQGTLTLQNEDYASDCAIVVPEGTCLVASWKKGTRFLRIRKK